jgi:hypothetical protein
MADWDAYHEFYERERVAAVAKANLTDTERAVLDALTAAFPYIDINRYSTGDYREEWEEIARIAAKAATVHLQPVTIGIGSPMGDLFIIETGETVDNDTPLYLLGDDQP